MASTLKLFRPCLWALVWGGGVLCSLYLVRGSFFLERTAYFSEGMETCFGRLRQSHILAMSGARGVAGEGAFLKGTESCFSEMVSYMEQHFSSSLVRALAPINDLAIDVHWFHKKLGQAGRNFAELEGARKGIVERLQEERSRRIDMMEWARRGLFIAWGMVVVLLFLPLVLFKKRALPKVSAAGQQEVPPLGGVLLGESIGKILGSLAGEIFSRGVRVDSDMGGELCIRSRSDSLERVLALLLSASLRSLKEGERLKISQQLQGERVLLSLGPWGQDGLKKGRGEEVSHLVKMCGGKIEKVSSEWIQLSFLSENPRQRRVFKGKKKDILRQLSSP